MEGFWHMERRELLQTPGGLSIDMFLAGPGQSEKPTVMLVGRVHPSETPASWIMRGACELLFTERSAEADACRAALSWVVVPMLNPDGVVLGNTRTNLAGVDLNRHHHDDAGPETIALRSLMGRVTEATGAPPLAFVDMHAHSRRRGIFLMGNAGASPRLISLLARESPHFDIAGSSLLPVQGTKDAGVGRVAAAARGCPHSFTLEASLGMAAAPCGHQLTPGDLEQLGRALMIALQKLATEGPVDPRAEQEAAALMAGPQDDD